jgi:hypothetical protein
LPETTEQIACGEPTWRVGDLAPNPLRFDFPRELEKGLVGDLCQRCAYPGCGRELSDQHRRLTDDALDQKRCLHASTLTPLERAENRRMSHS